MLAIATEGRAQVIMLGLVLGAYEEGSDTHSWRNPGQTTDAHLQHLTTLGYPLSEVERISAELPPVPTEG